MTSRAGALVALACATACGRAEPSAAASSAGSTAASDDEHAADLATLRAFEDARRRATDFAALPPSEAVLGPDPYRLVVLGDGAHLVGILRNDAAIVVIDRDGVESSRAPAPRSPSGLAVSPSGDVLVVGDGEREIAQYRVDGARIERIGSVALDALGLRDIALAPDGRTAYAVEEHDGRVLAVALARGANGAVVAAAPPRELARCHGPIRVATVTGAVAVDCLLDHAIEIWSDDGTHARIQHDGPIWSFALDRAPGGTLWLAAGGVEDHPLEREDGGFGYIDSFIYLYRLAPADRSPVQLAAIDSSELGVVTPKWIAIDVTDAGAIAVTSAGYATPAVVTLRWPRGDTGATPEVTRGSLLPGTTAAVQLADRTIAADPLLDGWVIAGGGAARVVPVATRQATRSLPSRVGELLFFTELMAPWNKTAGKLSRFTCETCHFEGYVDGRTHYTGRGDVFATTRPLYGLFNSRPYFSRALDRTMAQMVHNEFRVANRHNGRDPWFAVSARDLPWLAGVADLPAVLPPALLRESLMAFLMDFTHRANPAALERRELTPRERAGAEVFRRRCASCHAARLLADDPRSEVAVERWESLVLAPGGPIVWSNGAYARTGVVPYVHAEGTRVPTLRRLAKKWPYFTNGHARSLGDVLDRFGWTAAAAYHDNAPGDAARLPRAERDALAAFLDLL